MDIKVSKFIRKPIEVEGFQIESEQVLNSNLVKWAKSDTMRPKIGDWVVFLRGSLWVVANEEFDALFRERHDGIETYEENGSFTVKGNVKFDAVSKILYNDNGENCIFKFDANGDLINVDLL